MSVSSRCNPENSERYPCDEYQYNHCVGRLLVGVLKIVFRELGFDVIAYHQQRNGADMVVYAEGIEVFALEIINWNVSSRLYNKRRNCIITNLEEFDCQRIFVYTNQISKIQLMMIKAHNIHLFKIGYQILRKPCYEYFEETGRIIGRKVYSNSVKAEIRTKILEFLDKEYFGKGVNADNIHSLFT